MNKGTRIWLHGLGAAAIGGLSSGFVAGLTAMGIAPDKFNLSNGISATIEMAGVAALFNGLLSLAMYLKQSPLPPEAE